MSTTAYLEIIGIQRLSAQTIMSPAASAARAPAHITLLYMDRGMLVLNKPAGVVSQRTTSKHLVCAPSGGHVECTPHLQKARLARRLDQRVLQKNELQRTENGAST